MKFAGELFDRFYEPLVGSDQQVENLCAWLTRALHEPASDNVSADELYDRLNAGLLGAIADAAGQIEADNPRAPKRIQDTGIMGGQLTVASLRTVGDIYADRAKVPQRASNVSQSAERAVRTVFGMAFSGKLAGSNNIGALRVGVNPRNPLTQPLISAALAVAFVKGDAKVSRRAFRVTEVADGQLHVEPRYRRLRGAGAGRCPASFSTVEVVGKPRSGLATLMRTVGEVAVTEIYARQFAITTDA